MSKYIVYFSGAVEIEAATKAEAFELVTNTQILDACEHDRTEEVTNG